MLAYRAESHAEEFILTVQNSIIDNGMRAVMRKRKKRACKYDPSKILTYACVLVDYALYWKPVQTNFGEIFFGTVPKEAGTAGSNHFRHFMDVSVSYQSTSSRRLLSLITSC